MAAESNITLAIVIPAYRRTFLERAIQSVARQTDRRFRLYVGDDGSPDALESLARSSAAGCEFIYRRFNENLGARSLVGHWDRCIKLSREPWVWLFSDDDEMESDCVAAFHRTLDETKGTFDLYRFNTFIIGADDKVTAVNSPHPEVESGMSFAYHRLRGERHSTMQELVFSRAAYERVGGFPDLPCAWCSDDAGIVKLSGDKGVRTIPGPRVRFRQSGENVTSTFKSGRVNRDKRRATMQYITWLVEHFRGAQEEDTHLTVDMLRRAAERWFIGQCLNLETPCTVGEAREMAVFYSRMWGGSEQRHFLRYLKRNCELVFNSVVKRPAGAKA